MCKTLEQEKKPPRRWNVRGRDPRRLALSNFDTSPGAARKVCCPACDHHFEVDLAARFWAKVDKNGPNGCWLWMSSCSGGGYGQVSNRGGRRAHRVAYELLVGPIPKGLCLDHLCENPRCVNPDHLEPVTQRTNTLRSKTSAAAINERKTHCPQGHPYDEGNTRYKRDGSRVCRTCEKERARRYRAARA